MQFTKMHGCGNDFIVMDRSALGARDARRVARRICDRHWGVGADGLILVSRSQVADLAMEVINSDGSIARMCGNGLRCAAKYAIDNGWVDAEDLGSGSGASGWATANDAGNSDGTGAGFNRAMLAALCSAAVPNEAPVGFRRMRIETAVGTKSIVAALIGGDVLLVAVDLGPVSMRLADMACELPGPTAIDQEIIAGGTRFRLTCVHVGNSHAVCFVSNINAIDVERQGRAIEQCGFFPDGINVQFAQVLGADELALRTRERGAGVTLACGSGACAAAAVGVEVHGMNRTLQVQQLGGEVVVDVGESVVLCGPAVRICEGRWLSVDEAVCALANGDAAER